MHNKSGFTLIEIMVAIIIIALVAAITIPNLRRSKEKEERDKFVLELNGLTSFAIQNAAKTRKRHEVHLWFGKKEIVLNIAGEKDKYGKLNYIPVTRAYIKTKIKIPEQLELVNFYQDGVDLSRKVSSLKTGDAWFYISDNVSQAVILNFYDTKDKVGNKKREFGLVLNPFSAKFESYNEFKKP